MGPRDLAQPPVLQSGELSHRAGKQLAHDDYKGSQSHRSDARPPSSALAHRSRLGAGVGEWMEADCFSKEGTWNKPGCKADGHRGLWSVRGLTGSVFSFGDQLGDLDLRPAGAWWDSGPHFMCKFPGKFQEIEMGTWRRGKRGVRKKRAPWRARLIRVITS